MAKPIYHDLSLQIEQYIKGNNLTGKLPGTRTLSKIFKVHHVTLLKALHLLEDKGIVTINNNGVFVKSASKDRPKHKVLALVGQHMDFPGNQQILSTIKNHIQPYGYNLIGIAFDTDLFLNNKKILLNFPADGFIFRFSSLRNEQAKLLMQEKIPFVACARRKDMPDIDQTDCSHDYGYSLMLDELIKQGHRKIAFCEFGRIAEYQRYLKDIYALFKQNLGDDFNPDYFYVRETGLDLLEKYGEAYWDIYPRRAVEHFLSLNEVPTALIAPAPLFRKIYNILQEKGIRVPEDISLMCISYAGEKLPDIDVSGIVYDEQKMLIWAADRLIAKLENPDLPPASYFQQPIYNKGKTVIKNNMT